jgi:phosphate transport system substrate-binding protein
MTLAVTGTAMAAKTQTVLMSGATASYPLIELLTAKFTKVEKALKHHPVKVKFEVSQGGASVGIADVAAGNVNIGDSSRAPQSSDPTGLEFYPIAKYFVCVVTNTANPISNLTPTQVESIFEGKVRSWSQIPGSTQTGTIDVESRTSVAGVLTTFQNTLLAGGKVSSVATPWASEGLEQHAVESDPAAIGFLSDYFAVNNSINAVAYNGTACNVDNTVNGTYPGSADFYEVTLGPASGIEAKFINWIQTAKAAKKIIETSWIPLTGSNPPVAG